MPSDIKETELESSNQKASPSGGKDTGVVKVPCCAWKCAPTVISDGVNVPEDLGCYLSSQMHFQWGSQNIVQGFVPH